MSKTKTCHNLDDADSIISRVEDSLSPKILKAKKEELQRMAPSKTKELNVEAIQHRILLSIKDEIHQLVDSELKRLWKLVEEQERRLDDALEQYSH
ncbi:hypothetical protein J437_LFUL015751 [Ladona fulva]|uniref:Uncharacterized protein n=1 Tax=Ladona fulva TaxID=123851 RepID=A0A8K0KI99_LADFU|nr:hypothetical protein J437_LFUL015751 [Ladona fulva]